jgi:ZIP family zinc transporter
MVTVAAIFLSSLPEGLSSSAGMKRAGRTALYIFGVWGGIAVISGMASLASYTIFGGFSQESSNPIFGRDGAPHLICRSPI